MKLILFFTCSLIFATGVLVFAAGTVSAQRARPNAALEAKIRKLDLAHAEAILHRDVAALTVLIADDATTNHPTNRVVKEREGIIELIKNGTINYTSFVREPEAFLFFKDMVVVMGRETITPTGNAPGAGKTIMRRYTNVWMKRKGKWQLSIRHANIICSN